MIQQRFHQPHMSTEPSPSKARPSRMHADGKLIDVAVAAEAVLDLAFGPARADGEVCLDVRTLG